MNFDYGTMLSRSWQIAWRHKAIWGLVLSSMLLSFLMFPFFFAPMFFLQGDPSDSAVTIFLIAMAVFFLLFMGVSFLSNTIFLAAATLGVIRADRNEGSLSFLDLLRDGTQYFARTLGVMLITSLSMGLLFFIFFMLVFVLSIVTMGLASICLQPVMILLTPLMFLMVAVMEGAQTAVIAEDLGAMDAVKRALQVVRAHLWKYIIITVLIYFGITILSSIIMAPLMLPVFAVPFLIDPNTGLSPDIMIQVFIVFACIFFPISLAMQSVVSVFMKISLDLTYLRLAQASENQAVLLEEKA